MPAGPVTVKTGGTVEHYFIRRRGLLLLGGLLLIIVPMLLSKVVFLRPLTVAFAPTCDALGIALFIGCSLCSPGNALFKWLELQPIVYVGRMSYSLDLWQMIFCTKPASFGLDYSPWFLSFPLWLVPVFVVAFLSYEFVEQPFLRMKTRLVPSA
jgi:peptidoglycan/LPS O-acetylase OafA/YrhL